MFKIVVEGQEGEVLGQLAEISSSTLALREVSALRTSYPPGAIIRVYAAGAEIFSVECGTASFPILDDG